jgi:murein DD-endopeptidase MepM/ murein hydrolase activator NlpD
MRRFLTLMVIPHSDEHVREFNLAAPILWASACAVLVFVGISAYFAYGYFARIGAEIEYSSLTVENAELENHVNTLSNRMQSLSGRIQDLDQADTRMRAFARMAEPTVDGTAETLDLEAPQADWSTSYDYDSADEYASLDQLTREAKLVQAGLDSILLTVANLPQERSRIPSIFPVKGEGWYSSYFGYRTDPITGQRTFNNGIDIAGRKGTPIVATADGIVDAARHHQRLGYMVSIDHGNGLRTVYAHLEGLQKVQTGRAVARGEVIGKMDRTGTTRAVLLHYAVILNNKAQDPLEYIYDDDRRRSLF